MIKIYLSILLVVLLGGCFSKDDSSFNKDSSQWQHFKSKQAQQELDKE